jgi:exodeoxyribonuclease VII small subunit
VTFEEAQKELEAIVQRLESGEVPLDEALKLWERGESSTVSAESGSTGPRAGSRSSRRAQDANRKSRRIGAWPRLRLSSCNASLFEHFERRPRAARPLVQERTFDAGSTVAGEGEDRRRLLRDRAARRRSRCAETSGARSAPATTSAEIALIDDGARSATVTAVSDLRCYGLTSWEFRPLVESNASIAWKLLETMAQRLRAAQQR